MWYTPRQQGAAHHQKVGIEIEKNFLSRSQKLKLSVYQ